MKETLRKFYKEVLRPSPRFQEMASCKEDSEWHREESVLIHTDMVVEEYLKPYYYDDSIDDAAYIDGFLAVAFHDLGKPAAKTLKGDHNVFYGHELISARLAEDWLTSNDGTIQFACNIGRVLWLIENHLYYKTKMAWVEKHIDLNLYGKVIMADCRGRISDNHEDKIALAQNWLLGVDQKEHIPIGDKDIRFMIGCSGSGKSTFVESGIVYPVFSMDKLRLDWYSTNYSEAFKMSTEDTGFKNRVTKEFAKFLKSDSQLLFVDNCHVSRKSRAEFIHMAKKENCITTAIVMQNNLDNIRLNLEARTSKIVSFEVAKNQYFRTQQPTIGEFDKIQYVRPRY